MMKYKTQRNEEREKNTLLEAEKETGRQKKLEDDGKLKEFIHVPKVNVQISFQYLLITVIEFIDSTKGLCQKIGFNI